MLQLKIEGIFKNTFAVYVLEYNKKFFLPSLLQSKSFENKLKMFYVFQECFEKYDEKWGPCMRIM